jgi:hypothetical protein
MEIVKNKATWSVYASKCVKYYNISNDNIYELPEQYPCIAIPQLISDMNGSRIKFNFVYKKDCQRLLKAL